MASALGSKSSSLIESKANRWLLELTKELGEQFVEFVSYIRFSESQVKVIQETGLQLRHLVISKWFDIIGDHTTKYQYFVYDALRNLKRQDLLDKYFKKGTPEEYSEDILTDFLEALHAVDFSNLESRKSRQESKANRWLLELTKELGEQFVEFVSYIRFSESQVKVIQETGLQLRHLVISKWFDIIGDHTTKYQYFVYDALRKLKRQDLLDKYFKKGTPEKYSEDILTDFLEALHAVDFSNLESRKSRQGNGQKEKVKEKDSKDMCSTDDTTQEVSTAASASYCPRNPTLERERTNFARICIVVIDVITEVFQKLLQVQLPGSELTDALQKQKSKVIPYLNKRQKKIIYPQKVASAGSVQDFDITLVYILLRDLATIQAHENGWGNEPDTKDRSLSANIDRLRVQRNKVAHATIASLSDEDFDERWTIICQSVKDIHDNELKTGSFVMKMEDLRTGRIDSSREQYYISLVTEIKDEMKGLKETMKNLAGAMEGHKKKLDKTTAKVESMQESRQQPANITNMYGPTQIGNNNQMTNEIKKDPGDGIEESVKKIL